MCAARDEGPTCSCAARALHENIVYHILTILSVTCRSCTRLFITSLSLSVQVFKKGDEADGLYVLITGRVKLGTPTDGALPRCENRDYVGEDGSVMIMLSEKHLINQRC